MDQGNCLTREERAAATSEEEVCGTVGLLQDRVSLLTGPRGRLVLRIPTGMEWKEPVRWMRLMSG